MSEIRQYAPVIIPTLNRFEHFRRCLESLEQCTGANMTDVYVGLDYPPSEKFMEGWEKIDRYLKEKENKHSFHHLFVRRRKENCGVGNPNSNMILLIKEIEATSSFYICSEDDNEFSPCFLDFMNKCLEYYKDDPKVISISGFNQYYTSNSQLVFTYDNSGWGLGRWRNKYSPDINDTQKAVSEIKTVLKLFHYYPGLLNSILNSIKRGKVYGDASYTCYSIVHDCYQLRPAITLVRNWGHDGSGEHCGVSDNYINMGLPTQTTFSFQPMEPERTKEIDSLVRKNMMPKSRFRRFSHKVRVLFASIVHCLKSRSI